ncbi:FAD/FMN-containing protein [Corynespora cassiicola Philippines]|uniref:FAD/FMN-containing protein n=1 Tax=Corynespora cassiicola Philippines TaxID=1448308 RepID=A0A2T2NT46_CORCC|nr:FAD/FMN-containing protein [Corynespora cassiicola Philippines]
MKLVHVSTLFASLQIGSAGPRLRCTAHDPCWPSMQEWNLFNESITGQLISSRPPAHICHGVEYDEHLCATAKANWTSSDWRTAQPGAYSAIVWELGPEQCFINSSISSPCEQGLVADMTVNASSVQDIQKAIRFAAEKDLYLVIKNTGHDHLGRSSGDGAFAIWTHNMKGREWHDGFVPQNAPLNAEGVKAVTLQAGEQWLDVYRDADSQGRIVVGGSARTVGAAGGWFTGGGHSPWSHFYGMGADNVLEVNVVTATGETKTLNEFTDSEHFWAIRGGGGNSWGVVTSVTYKTHPNPTHIKTIAAQYNTNDSLAQRKVLRQIFKAIPVMTDLGYTGYATLGAPIGLIFLQPNGTNSTAYEAVKLLQNAGNVTGVETVAGGFDFPSWIEYCNAFLQDPNIATNVIDPSRLLTSEVLQDRTDDLLRLIDDFPDLAAGFNFIGKVDSRSRDSTAVHSIWKDSRAVFSMGTNWSDDAPETEKRHKKERGIEASKRMAEIVGMEGGTYMNEANPYEPYWKEAFWGGKYVKLERVKRRVDPKGLFVCNRCVGEDLVYEP